MTAQKGKGLKTNRNQIRILDLFTINKSKHKRKEKISQGKRFLNEFHNE
jgi:hypothetical protein